MVKEKKDRQLAVEAVQEKSSRNSDASEKRTARKGSASQRVATQKVSVGVEKPKAKTAVKPKKGMSRLKERARKMLREKEETPVARPLVVRQEKSAIRRTAVQERTLRSLGLRGIGSEKALPDTPAVRGMIEKVKHLVVLGGKSL